MIGSNRESVSTNNTELLLRSNRRPGKASQKRILGQEVVILNLWNNNKIAKTANSVSVCDKQKNNRAAMAEEKAKASGYLAGLGGGQRQPEPQNNSYREERKVNNFQNGMLIFTRCNYRTRCIISTWLQYSSYVCFLCVAVSILMSPYMRISYRMFSLFNVILLKSIGPLVRYIINIISLQPSNLHTRNRALIFTDIMEVSLKTHFFLTSKTWCPFVQFL